MTLKEKAKKFQVSITQSEAWILVSFLYVFALLLTTIGTINICEQINTNTVNPTWLKALPIIDYLMLGGAVILSITGSFVGTNEYKHPQTSWSRLAILFIIIFLSWIFVTLISNAIFYDQVQDNTINTEFKDFVLVSNAITLGISMLITSPLWAHSGGFVG